MKDTENVFDGFALLGDDEEFDVDKIFGSGSDEPAPPPPAPTLAEEVKPQFDPEQVQTETAESQHEPEQTLPAKTQEVPAEEKQPLELFSAFTSAESDPIPEAAPVKSIAPRPQTQLSLFDKPPVFQYGGAREQITDASMTFEALRIQKADDFPELEDASAVTWQVRYGDITKTVSAPKTDTIAAMKAEIEKSKAFLDSLKKGKVKDNFKFIAFGGDGGTYDIGIQSLSGAMERGHDMVYVCYDNEAYMNTGIQRSSSTPRFADATTSPAGTEIPGKVQNKKDLTAIIAAHNVPYAAQTTFIGNFKDLHEKARKAIYTEGPCFLNILSPCPRGWRYETEDLAEICQLAVDTCAWPMYEIIDGTWNLTYEPKKKLPIEEFLKKQGRFKHMFRKGNEWMIEETQKYVDDQWEKLLERCR